MGAYGSSHVQVKDYGDDAWVFGGPNVMHYEHIYCGAFDGSHMCFCVLSL